MEARKKANELFNKMYKYQLNKRDNVSWDLARKQALIAVDEILKFEQLYLTRLDAKMNLYLEESSVEYWQEVKSEIEKL